MEERAKFYVMLNGKKTAISVDENGKLVVPHGVKKIGGDQGKCSFVKDYDRDSIHEIEFPDTLEEIEDFSLYACPCSPLYKKIILPKSVKRIGRYAFQENVELEYLETSAEVICEGAFNESSLNKVVLHEGVKEIQSEAFAYCDIDEIKLPSTLEFLDLTAFDSHVEIIFPKTEKPIEIDFDGADSPSFSQDCWFELLKHCPEACALICEGDYDDDKFIDKCKAAMVEGMKWRNEVNGATLESAKNDITLMHEFDAEIKNYKRELLLAKELERIETERENALESALKNIQALQSPEQSTNQAFDKFLGKNKE